MLTIEMFHGGKIEHSLKHQELDLHHMPLCHFSADAGLDPALMELFPVYGPYSRGPFSNSILYIYLPGVPKKCIHDLYSSFVIGVCVCVYI